jgi:beta-N-acetylhexosaminidase
MKMLRLRAVAALVVPGLFACLLWGQAPTDPVPVAAPAKAARKARKASKVRPKAAASKAVPKNEVDAAALAILNAMPLEDRVAQMVLGVAYGDVYSTQSADYHKYQHWIGDLHLGGLIVINEVEFGSARNANPFAMAIFLNQMQRMSKVPLLVGADFERAASMRVTGGTQFPHSMAFGAGGDLEASKYEGLITAREARALGVHWVFAPVADVNNNPRNPIINIRAYGEDPDLVSSHVRAFIEGAHQDPAAQVLVTAKHFPGHGDVEVDSHLSLPRLNIPRHRMDATELKPFRAAIAQGVDSIMTAHMAVPELDPSGVPATTSAKILTDLLRQQLHFDKLIVTDAMNMDGLTETYNNADAAVRSVIAGADVLLMPPDPDTAIRAVLAAIQEGRISRERINESAFRILQAKVGLGLMQQKLVDLDAIADTLASPAAANRAQQIADKGVTLLRNEGKVVPLPAAGAPCLVVINSLRTSQQGLRIAREFRRRAPRGQAFTVDTSMPMAALEAAIDHGRGCTSIVAASFAAITANTSEVNRMLTKLTEGTAPVILLSFNDPFMGGLFPKAAAYMTPFSSAQSSEYAVVRALFGEIEITGKTPVTIPQMAPLGAGIVTTTRNVARR